MKNRQSKTNSERVQRYYAKEKDKGIVRFTVSLKPREERKIRRLAHKYRTTKIGIIRQLLDTAK